MTIKLNWERVWREFRGIRGPGDKHSVSGCDGTICVRCKELVEEIVTRHIREAGDNWIDAKKRKPKAGGPPILVQTEIGTVREAEFHHKEFCHPWGTPFSYRVLYWQPLPEPRAKARTK